MPESTAPAGKVAILKPPQLARKQGSGRYNLEPAFIEGLHDGVWLAAVRGQIHQLRELPKSGYCYYDLSLSLLLLIILTTVTITIIKITSIAE